MALNKILWKIALPLVVIAVAVGLIWYYFDATKQWFKDWIKQFSDSYNSTVSKPPTPKRTISNPDHNEIANEYYELLNKHGLVPVIQINALTSSLSDLDLLKTNKVFGKRGWGFWPITEWYKLSLGEFVAEKLATNELTYKRFIRLGILEDS
jgi:hypothetical protein